MRSLADTHALLESLTAEASAASHMAADAQGCEAPGLLQTAPQQTASTEGASSSLAWDHGMGTDFVNQAYSQGIVVDIMAPDCAAHGVGVAVHLFRQQW